MGRRKGTTGLTPLELEIMNVLWETGPANVQTVRQRLGRRRDLAYTTVQTMIRPRRGTWPRCAVVTAPAMAPAPKLESSAL